MQCSKMRVQNVRLVAVVSLVTFLSIVYYLNDDYFLQSLQPTQSPWDRSKWPEEIPPKFIFATHRLTPSLNNLFFVETSCGVNQEKFRKQGLLLKATQACAIYSAAFHNPSKQVFLIYTCPLLPNFYEKSPAVTRILIDLPNFSVVQANLTAIYENSPLWSFFIGPLRKSLYPVEHCADVLRILLVYLFGGTYMDLDVVSLRPLNELGVNYIGSQQSDQLGTAVLNFEPRHPYLEKIIRETQEAYNPRAWAAAGPVLATSVLRKYCNVSDAADLEKIGLISSCGIMLWGYKVFYPIRYSDWSLFWKNTTWPQVEPLLNETVAVHFWNHMIEGGARVAVGSDQPFAKLAEQNCAPIFSPEVEMTNSKSDS